MDNMVEMYNQRGSHVYLIFYCSIELDNSATFMSHQRKQKHWISFRFKET